MIDVGQGRRKERRRTVRFLSGLFRPQSEMDK